MQQPLYRSILLSSIFLSVFLIDQVHHHLHHDILLLCLALGNHQGKCYERVVCQSLGAVFTVEDAVVVEEPQEERGGNALVAVAERVVLGDKVEQHGCLLFHTRIQLLATEGLIDLTDTALEGVVLLVTEERTATKFVTQGFDGFHGVLVGGMKLVLLSSLTNIQSLVVVIIEGVESVGVIHDNIKQCLVFIIRLYLLALYSTPHHLHQLAQFSNLLAVYALVNGIAFDEILLQNLVGPLAELNASVAFHTIANGDDDIKIVERNRLFYSINVLTQLFHFELFSKKLQLIIS